MLQDLLDRYRMTKLDKLDWITRNRLNVKKEKKIFSRSIQKHQNLKSKQNILFWATGAWERGALEHMLAFSLLLRGHKIQGVRCAGGFSACSMESCHFKRPNCDDCVDRSKRLLDVFGIEEYYKTTQDFLSEEEIRFCDSEIDGLHVDDFLSYTYKGYSIGEWVKRDLPQYYFRIMDIKDSKETERIRKILKSTLMYTISAVNAVEKIKPDRCCVTSGKTVAYGPFFQVCLSKGIPVMTWDENPNGKDAFVFKFNEYANEYRLNKEWEKIKEQAFTNHDEELAIRFYARNAIGKLARREFYENPIREEDKIIEMLGLDRSKRIIVLLTNLTWDTSSLGRDIAFDGMLDWIRTTIEYLGGDERVQVIVRAHPAEGRCPKEMESTETVTGRLREQVDELKSNIILVDGFSEINSHILCKISDLISVYSTTVGLEMAMRGYPVVVCGECHYSRRGFTIDIENKPDYFKVLDEFKSGEELVAPQRSKQLSYQYAAFFIKMVPAYIKEFNFPNRHIFEIENVKDFLPGESQRWDSLCDHFLNDGDMLGMSPHNHSLPPLDDNLMKLWELR